MTKWQISKLRNVGIRAEDLRIRKRRPVQLAALPREGSIRKSQDGDDHEEDEHAADPRENVAALEQKVVSISL